MKFEEITVKELREESRNRGLTLEHKGHKFTKLELIERIKEHDKMLSEVDEHIMGKKVETKQEAKTQEHKKHVPCKVNNTDKTVDNYAKTLAEIEEKYGGDGYKNFVNDMKVGNLIVFVHYVEALNHNIYKILRKAKVTAINRKKEIVRIETRLGTVLELGFNEVLWVTDAEKGYYGFPRDINDYMRRNSKWGKEKQKQSDRP